MQHRSCGARNHCGIFHLKEIESGRNAAFDRMASGVAAPDDLPTRVAAIDQRMD
jgi:hypothetical protein